jgi:taurine dioxygenase
MQAAFDALSARMQDYLAGLRGIHATGGALLDYVRTHLPPGRVEETLARVGSGAVHPIVRTHPVSRRRALYFELNFMRRIEGLSTEETRFVRGLLARQVENVSLQCRFRWRPGDVVIWDERSTQHIGAADHAGQRRVLKRCLVAGERPA